MLVKTMDTWELDLDHTLYPPELIEQVSTLFTHVSLSTRKENGRTIISGDFLALRSFADFLITQRRSTPQRKE